MTYGYIYVASVSMGANQGQFIRALSEAEAYPGPSLIIAYAPCINHGINMSKSQHQGKMAVESGYWPLYRYNPTLADAGENPLVLDYKELKGGFREFIMSETRYRTLPGQFPEEAERLFTKSEQEAISRHETLKRLAARQPE